MAGKTKPTSKTSASTTKKAASPAKKMASPAKKAASPVKTSNGTTEFVLSAPNAQEVFVVGEFDGWDTHKNRMRRFKDGVWKKKIKLPAGRYEYRFRVDNDWQSDPECPEQSCNPYGTKNSVVTVGS